MPMPCNMLLCLSHVPLVSVYKLQAMPNLFRPPQYGLLPPKVFHISTSVSQIACMLTMHVLGLAGGHLSLGLLLCTRFNV